jgi:hypothetical protein
MEHGLSPVKVVHGLAELMPQRDALQVRNRNGDYVTIGLVTRRVYCRGLKRDPTSCLRREGCRLSMAGVTSVVSLITSPKLPLLPCKTRWI